MIYVRLKCGAKFMLYILQPRFLPTADLIMIFIALNWVLQITTEGKGQGEAIIMQLMPLDNNPWLESMPLELALHSYSPAALHKT